MIIPLAGLSVLGLAGVPWLLVIARRASYLFAVAAVVIGGVFGLLLGMLATWALQVPLLLGVTVIAAWWERQPSHCACTGVHNCAGRSSGGRGLLGWLAPGSG